MAAPEEEESEISPENLEVLEKLETVEPPKSSGFRIGHKYNYEGNIYTLLGIDGDEAAIESNEGEKQSISLTNLTIPKDSANAIMYLTEKQANTIQGAWNTLRPFLRAGSGEDNAGFFEKTSRHAKRLGVRAWLRVKYGVSLKFCGEEEEFVDLPNSTIPYKFIRDEEFFQKHVADVEKSIVPDIGNPFEHGF